MHVAFGRVRRKIAMKTLLRWLSITLCLYALGGHPATAQNAYELGEAALQLENYEEAIQHFTSAEKSGKTLARLGYAHSQLGHYAEATRAYQEALHKDNVESQTAVAQALLGLGYIAYQQGKFDDAIRRYTEVVQQDMAGIAEAHHNLGRIYAGRGEIEKAVTAQQHAIAEDPNLAEAHYHLGILYSRKQDWQTAIAAYQKTIALTPTMPNAYYQLARCYQQTGDILETEKAMQRFRDLKVADTEIQKQLEAVFVADTDEKAEAFLQLANTYLKHERYEKATQTFKRIGKYSTSDTHTAQVSAGLASVALEQGHPKQAVTHYERAIVLGLETAEIYHNLGIAYMQNRDGENALKQLHRALEINPNLPETLTMLGTLYAAKNKFDEAETHYERAIVLAPEAAMAYHGLAYLYGRHNQKLEKAVELARHATKLSPDSAPYYNTLSWLCYKIRKYDAAETAILKAIELAPDNPLYQEGLAEIRQREK
ncbi:tetratricopeptide repeat protein [Candidatus Poribacteria bacterium]|nr:tetratricopeptide repeat protein [Candidatus Poribacteria bacterium]